MSRQDVNKILENTPLVKCKVIVNIAQKVIKNMYDNDLTVSEQLLLPKVLEIAIADLAKMLPVKPKE